LRNVVVPIPSESQVSPELIVVEDTSQKNRLAGPGTAVLHNLNEWLTVIIESARHQRRIVSSAVIDSVRLGRVRS